MFFVCYRRHPPLYWFSLMGQVALLEERIVPDTICNLATFSLKAGVPLTEYKRVRGSAVGVSIG